MNVARKQRLVLAKIGLDAHDIGIRYIARLLRDAGVEVIYLGLYQTVPKVVATAIQEDVDVIGLSFLGGDHLTFTPQILSLIKAKNMHIPVIVGGVIPIQDITVLKEMGVADIFRQGTPAKTIINSIEKLVLESKEQV